MTDRSMLGAPPAGPAPAAASTPQQLPAPAAKPIRRRGHLGSFSVAQIALVEIAVLAAVAVASRGPVPGLIGGVGGALVILFALARRHHRWWLEDTVMSRRLRRRRGAALDPAASPALAALRSLAPRLTIRDVSAPDGARVGVGADEAGWFAAVALTPAAPAHHEAAPIPLDALVGLLADADQPGAVLQLVTHTVAAPSLELHHASPASSSYRQLTTAHGSPPMPAYRESIVVARLDAVALAEALLDHTTDPGAAAALVAGLGRRVARSLRRFGIACRVLDADELLRALARSCDVEPATGAEPGPMREEWTQWHSARLTHRTFWLKTWPAAEQVGPLLERMTAVPAAQSDLAIVLEPGGGEDVAIRLLIRMAAPPEVLPELTTVLLDTAAQAGGELVALDGEQGPGVYATAPTGGGAG